MGRGLFVGVIHGPVPKGEPRASYFEGSIHSLKKNNQIKRGNTWERPVSHALRCEAVWP